MIAPFGSLTRTAPDDEILIIGTGAGGMAAAECLYESTTAPITLLERGSVILPVHFNNLCENALRRKFIDLLGTKDPWEGDLTGAMLFRAAGGRVEVAGTNRPRFYSADYTCFPKGEWPRSVVEALPALYEKAESNQRVGDGDLPSASQEWTKLKLHDLKPVPPRIAFSNKAEGFAAPWGYDSAMKRFAALQIRDVLENRVPRLRLLTGCYVTKIVHNGKRAFGVMCISTGGPGEPRQLLGANVVVAASPVESARLVMNSGLANERPAAGRFLAEHIERRAKFRIALPHSASQRDGISLIVPPQSDAPEDRFQLHLRGQTDPSDDRYAVVDCGVFGAVDPSWDNRVTLAHACDEFGVPRARTEFQLSEDDQGRARKMSAQIEDICARLGGQFITEQFPLELAAPCYTDQSHRIEVMAPGRSYHEAGTLRMGAKVNESACDETGRVHGIENIWVTDASLFPCVGVANPILTVSALAYWVCRHIASHHRAERRRDIGSAA